MDIRKEFELFEAFSPELTMSTGVYDSPYMYYNAALEKLKQGSDDMAIILLKKVIASEEFIPSAYVLLALCLYKNKETFEARNMLKIVLKKDPNDSLARHYMSKLFDQQDGRKERIKPQKVKAVPKSPPKRVSPPHKVKADKKEPAVPVANTAVLSPANMDNEDKTRDISLKIQETIARNEKKPVRKVSTGNGGRRMSGNKKNSSAPLTFILALLFMAAGIFVGYYLGSRNTNSAIPEDTTDTLMQYQEQVRSLLEKEDNLQNTLKQQEKTIQNLNDEKKNLQDKLLKMQEAKQVDETKQRLDELKALANGDDNLAVVQVLKTFPSEKLIGTDLEVYKAIADKAYRTFCTERYEAGMVQYNNQNYEKANEFFTEAIETGFVFELSSDLQYRSGRCFYEKGEYDKAIVFFADIVEKSPGYVYGDYAAYYLGRSYQYQGKNKEAKDAFEFAKDTYPKSPLMEHIVARINEVSKG